MAAAAAAAAASTSPHHCGWYYDRVRHLLLNDISSSEPLLFTITSASGINEYRTGLL
jgi:hypothetical protein